MCQGTIALAILSPYQNTICMFLLCVKFSEYVAFSRRDLAEEDWKIKRSVLLEKRVFFNLAEKSIISPVFFIYYKHIHYVLRN